MNNKNLFSMRFDSSKKQFVDVKKTVHLFVFSLGLWGSINYNECSQLINSFEARNQRDKSHLTDRKKVCAVGCVVSFSLFKWRLIILVKGSKYNFFISYIFFVFPITSCSF